MWFFGRRSTKPDKEMSWNERITAQNIIYDETWNESFNRRHPEYPTEILPGLYLSNVKTAAAYLTAHFMTGTNRYPAISRIVSIMPEVYGDGKADLPQPRGPGKDIKRLIISKFDSSAVNLLEDFDRAANFIHEGMQEWYADRQIDASNGVTELTDKSGGVLIHCHAGISRSVTILMAYILKYRQAVFRDREYMDREGLTEADFDSANRRHADTKCRLTGVPLMAYFLIWKQRTFINPNPGFCQQLQYYHDTLNCSITDEAGKRKQAYLAWLNMSADEKKAAAQAKCYKKAKSYFVAGDDGLTEDL